MPGISWGADTISAFQKRSGSCVAAVFVAGQLQQEGRRRLSLSRPTGEQGHCLLAGLVSAHGGSVITDTGISSTSVFQCLLALTFTLCTHACEVVNPCQTKPTSLFRVLAPSPVPEQLRNPSLTSPEHFPLPKLPPESCPPAELRHEQKEEELAQDTALWSSKLGARRAGCLPVLTAWAHTELVLSRPSSTWMGSITGGSDLPILMTRLADLQRVSQLKAVLMP